MVKKKADSRKAVEGLVLPNKWDEKGQIVGIAIHTNKEEVYLVTHNRLERELLSHLHLKVGVKGKITERLDGSKLIHVKSFQPISLYNSRISANLNIRRNNKNENKTIK